MDVIKTPKGEMTLEYYALMQYKRINTIMKMIEDTFNVSLNDYEELRHYILDTSNFVKRLPSMVEKEG